MALEAMASKIPIIATSTGGLKETIIDMRIYPEIGTGLLIDINNPSQFAKSLISLFKALEVAEKTAGIADHSIYKTEILNIVNQIPDEIIKSRVLLDTSYYYKVKENGYNRVKEHFTWEIVSKKLSNLYLQMIGINKLV
jgi:starch synthase